MNKPSDDRGLFSRLPDEPEYWDKLSARIVSDAVPTLADYREESGEWWTVLARHSTSLAVGAAAAVVAAVILLPSQASERAETLNSDAFGLAPTGPLMAPLVVAESPPSMEAMLLLHTSERDE